MNPPVPASKDPHRLTVELGERSYPILFHSDLPCATWEGCPIPPESRVLLVSDKTVEALFAARVASALKFHRVQVSLATVAPGEGSKSLETAGWLYSQAARAKLDRGSTIIALGGGVVGDLAGFVAATFLRGLRLVQIPTTLLSMVDSSVGGKTAINLPEGKNLVGAFHQPSAVVIAISTLDSLPYREFAAGMAEVVKYGAIRDESLLALIETHAEMLSRPDADTDVLQDIVARCCGIKADVVASDEREQGERAILNFGHTLGHALEKTLGYGLWLHGEAVAFGMVYAARLAEISGVCGTLWADRLATLCARFGLPVSRRRLAGSSGGAGPGWEEVRAAMSGDKKTRDGALQFVLCDRPGHALFGCRVSEADLLAAWNAM